MSPIYMQNMQKNIHRFMSYGQNSVSVTFGDILRNAYMFYQLEKWQGKAVGQKPYRKWCCWLGFKAFWYCMGFDILEEQDYYRAWWWPGDRLNIKTLSYQYRDSHYEYKTVSRPSYIHDGNPIPERTLFILRQGHDSVHWWVIIRHPREHTPSSQIALETTFSGRPKRQLRRRL